MVGPFVSVDGGGSRSVAALFAFATAGAALATAVVYLTAAGPPAEVLGRAPLLRLFASHSPGKATGDRHGALPGHRRHRRRRHPHSGGHAACASDRDAGASATSVGPDEAENDDGFGANTGAPSDDIVAALQQLQDGPFSFGGANVRVLSRRRQGERRRQQRLARAAAATTAATAVSRCGATKGDAHDLREGKGTLPAPPHARSYSLDDAVTSHLDWSDVSWESTASSPSTRYSSFSSSSTSVVGSPAHTPTFGDVGHHSGAMYGSVHEGGGGAFHYRGSARVSGFADALTSVFSGSGVGGGVGGGGAAGHSHPSVHSGSVCAAGDEVEEERIEAFARWAGGSTVSSAAAARFILRGTAGGPAGSLSGGEGRPFPPWESPLSGSGSRRGTAGRLWRRTRSLRRGARLVARRGSLGVTAVRRWAGEGLSRVVAVVRRVLSRVWVAGRDSGIGTTVGGEGVTAPLAACASSDPSPPSAAEDAVKAFTSTILEKLQRDVDLHKQIDDMLEPLRATPGRVPTVAIVRVPPFYDTSSDIRSLWRALKHDPTVAEDDLVDVVVMASFDPHSPEATLMNRAVGPHGAGAVRSVSAALGNLGPSAMGGLSWNPFTSPLAHDAPARQASAATVMGGEAPGAARLRAPPLSLPLGSPPSLGTASPGFMSPVYLPGGASGAFPSRVDGGTASDTTEYEVAREMTFEVVPAYVYYAHLARCCVLQEKDNEVFTRLPAVLHHLRQCEEARRPLYPPYLTPATAAASPAPVPAPPIALHGVSSPMRPGGAATVAPSTPGAPRRSPLPFSRYVPRTAGLAEVSAGSCNPLDEAASPRASPPLFSAAVGATLPVSSPGSLRNVFRQLSGTVARTLRSPTSLLLSPFSCVSGGGGRFSCGAAASGGEGVDVVPLCLSPSADAAPSMRMHGTAGGGTAGGTMSGPAGVTASGPAGLAGVHPSSPRAVGGGGGAGASRGARQVVFTVRAAAYLSSLLSPEGGEVAGGLGSASTREGGAAVGPHGAPTSFQPGSEGHRMTTPPPAGRREWDSESEGSYPRHRPAARDGAAEGDVCAGEPMSMQKEERPAVGTVMPPPLPPVSGAAATPPGPRQGSQTCSPEQDSLDTHGQPRGQRCTRVRSLSLEQLTAPLQGVNSPSMLRPAGSSSIFGGDAPYASQPRMAEPLRSTPSGTMQRGLYPQPPPTANDLQRRRFAISLLKVTQRSQGVLEDLEKLLRRVREHWRGAIQDVLIAVADLDRQSQQSGPPTVFGGPSLNAMTPSTSVAERFFRDTLLPQVTGSLTRRAEMREALMEELAATCFTVCEIPIPDPRVYRYVPAAVPRYIAAHARGFPLQRTFAEEILSQQRLLQSILIAMEEHQLRRQARRDRRRQRRAQARMARRQRRGHPLALPPPLNRAWRSLRKLTGTDAEPGPTANGAGKPPGCSASLDEAVSSSRGSVPPPPSAGLASKGEEHGGLGGAVGGRGRLAATWETGAAGSGGTTAPLSVPHRRHTGPDGAEVPRIDVPSFPLSALEEGVSGRRSSARAVGSRSPAPGGATASERPTMTSTSPAAPMEVGTGDASLGSGRRLRSVRASSRGLAMLEEAAVAAAAVSDDSRSTGSPTSGGAAATSSDAPAALHSSSDRGVPDGRLPTKTLRASSSLQCSPRQRPPVHAKEGAAPGVPVTRVRSMGQPSSSAATEEARRRGLWVETITSTNHARSGDATGGPGVGGSNASHSARTAHTSLGTPPFLPLSAGDVRAKVHLPALLPTSSGVGVVPSEGRAVYHPPRGPTVALSSDGVLGTSLTSGGVAPSDGARMGLGTGIATGSGGPTGVCPLCVAAAASTPAKVSELPVSGSRSTLVDGETGTAHAGASWNSYLPPAPCNSMYGTYDAYYGHTVAAPQAVLLRQQALLEVCAVSRRKAERRRRSSARLMRASGAGAVAGMHRSVVDGQAFAGAGAAHGSAVPTEGHTLSAGPGSPEAPFTHFQRLCRTASLDSIAVSSALPHRPASNPPAPTAAAVATLCTNPLTSARPTLVSENSSLGAVPCPLGVSSFCTAHALHGGCRTSAGDGGAWLSEDDGHASSAAGALTGAGLAVGGSRRGVGGGGTASASSAVIGRTPLSRYGHNLLDLLGAYGGPMYSGITYYYTFGDAQACLFNASMQPRPEETELWERAPVESPGTHEGGVSGAGGSNGGGGGGALARSTAPPTGVEARPGATLASTPPPMGGAMGNGPVEDYLPVAKPLLQPANGGASDGAAPAAPVDDEGCSYFYPSPPSDDEGAREEARQAAARESRSTAFYSLFHHLHHTFFHTVLKPAGPLRGAGARGTVSAAAAAAAAAAAQSPLYTGVGAGREGGEEPHPPAAPTASSMRVGGAAAPHPTLLERLRDGLRRMLGLPPAAASAAGAPDGPAGGEGAGQGGSGADCVRFANRARAREAMNPHNGSFGLTPFEVWLACRYSRKVAAEVYVMDISEQKGDPFFPVVRVVDEVVAHAVLYYHNRSLRDFLEELRTQFDLVYEPRTPWGRYRLGYPVSEAASVSHSPPTKSPSGSLRSTEMEAARRGTVPPGAGPVMGGEAAAAPAALLGGRTTPRPALSRSGPGRGGDSPDNTSPLIDLALTESPALPEMAPGLAAAETGDRPSTTAMAGDTTGTATGATAAAAAAHRGATGDDTLDTSVYYLGVVDQQEDEILFLSVENCLASDAAKRLPTMRTHEEELEERLMMGELRYVKEFLLEHRNVLSSASLTPAGSNRLEGVFGAPATVFPFLQCARESIGAVQTMFDSLEKHYGILTFEAFARYLQDVFGRDHPEIVRHAPRIFRTLNKSRCGHVTFEELCSWMARKLSCGSNQKPDAHLLATTMSLRLPLTLLLGCKEEWSSSMSCTLHSLSDGEDY